MPTNYNFKYKPNYFELAFPNVTDAQRQVLFTQNDGYATGFKDFAVSVDESQIGPTGKVAAKYVSQAAATTTTYLLHPSNQASLFKYFSSYHGYNESWTLSFWIKCNIVPASPYQISGGYALKDKGSGTGADQSITNPTSWSFFSFTVNPSVITFPESFTNALIVPALRFQTGPTINPGDIFWLSDISFTKNTNATITTSFDNQFIPADTFRQGNLYGWGPTNRIGIVPDGSLYKSSPVLVNNFSNWKTLNEPGGVNTTTYTMLAIDYSGYLWFWGNSNVPSNWPVSTTIGLRQTYTTPQLSSTSNTWIVAGQFDSGGGAAIKTDGTLWTWGRATVGRLGTNSSVDSPTLVQEFTSSTNWKTLSCGSNHVAAIKTDGTLWTWGRNNFGQLGVNDIIERSTPVQEFTSSTNWKSVSCSSISTSAIKTNGTMFLWGSGDTTTPRMPSGASSGLPSEGAKSIPYQENTLSTNWKQVTTSPAFSATGVYNTAIKNDGTAWTWQYVPLTNSSVSLEISIVQFANQNNFFWKKCFAGNPTYLIKNDSTLWGYGDNSEGQLGIGDLIFRATPVQIASFSNIKEVKSALTGTNTSNVWALRYIDPII